MHTLHRLSLALASFAMASAAWAYPEYRVTIVGPAGSTAADINGAGAVVGNYRLGDNTTRGFVNRGKGVVVLGPLGGVSSNAAAINDKGEVLGNWIGADGLWQGYVYACGKQRNIGLIYANTFYQDINNAGYIVANAATTDRPGLHGILRAPNGSFRDLGSVAAWSTSTPLPPPGCGIAKARRQQPRSYRRRQQRAGRLHLAWQKNAEPGHADRSQAGVDLHQSRGDQRRRADRGQRRAQWRAIRRAAGLDPPLPERRAGAGRR